MSLDNTLDDVKNRVDLLSYILRTSGGAVVHNGSNSRGKYKRIDPCPICGHKDHFDIYENTNSYCSRSGCCNGGSIIDFLMEHEKLPKAEAIKKAKELAGMDNTADKKNVPQSNTARNNSMPEIKGIESADFTSLIDEVHRNVVNTDYFKNRGFTKTIDNYKLGYHEQGFNYAIAKNKGVLQEKPNDLNKAYKYFIPTIDKDGKSIYFITRKDDTVPLPEWVKGKPNKTHNLKGFTPVPLNLRYLYEPFSITDIT
jgi:replicative DNA helicase